MKKITVILSLFLCGFNTQISAIPAQVMIIRHAEKDSTGNLSERGLERAGALAPYISLSSFLLNFGTPVAIFAARPNLNTPPFHPDEGTARCLQTVGPTAAFLKLPIHPGYAKLQESEIANFILNHSAYDGKNVLICWHHDVIQALAIALGAASAPPFPEVFDQIWVITYSPIITLTIYQQSLLFGDTP